MGDGKIMVQKLQNYWIQEKSRFLSKIYHKHFLGKKRLDVNFGW